MKTAKMVGGKMVPTRYARLVCRLKGHAWSHLSKTLAECDRCNYKLVDGVVCPHTEALPWGLLKNDRDV